MTTKATLVKVSTLLSQVVGKQDMVKMTPSDFVQFAMAEIAKAQTESLALSTKRLELLQKNVMYSSAIIEDTDADSIKVPVFVLDQTTFAEQANNVSTPAQAAAMNPASGTVFEGGFTAKRLAELSKLIDEMGKADPEDGEGDGEMGDEEEAKVKAKAAAEEEEKTKKSAEWPEDMNHPAFVKDGVTKRDLEWGEDNRSQR